MKHMQAMAKAYLDWWETYWEQSAVSVQTLEDMQKVWSSFAKTYEDALKTSTEQVWK